MDLNSLGTKRIRFTSFLPTFLPASSCRAPWGETRASRKTAQFVCDVGGLISCELKQHKLGKAFVIREMAW
jgi:hypothetical protein